MTASLRPDGDEDELRSLVRWLRDEDDLRGRVESTAAPIAPGRMGAGLDAAVVVVTSGTATVVVRSLFDWLKHRRSAAKVTLTLRTEDGRELELTCGSADDAQATVVAVRGFLEA
ncbi:effector-associated constant component EACC1 [Actinosynnema sp. CS-041913]|uniref:effector-associated constant component EACC1 n=1 Tax=Actinosynnema sp. CS-041913 TaxID=3239917 RepID=UPI003D91BFD7